MCGRLGGSGTHIEPDDGVVDPEAFMATGPVRHWEREPKVRDLA
jgi:catalase